VKLIDKRNIIKIICCIFFCVLFINNILKEKNEKKIFSQVDKDMKMVIIEENVEILKIEKLENTENTLVVEVKLVVLIIIEFYSINSIQDILEK